MLKKIFLFLLLLGIWIFCLWYVVGFDLGGHSLLALAMAHLGPPVGTFSCGWLIWRGVLRKKQETAQRQAELERESAQKAVQEAVAKRRQELSERRFAIDCLSVAFGGLWERSGSDESFIEAVNERVSVDRLDRPPYFFDEDEDRDAPPAEEYLEEVIGQTLSNIYAQCPGSEAFPILALGPDSLPEEMLGTLIRRVQAVAEGESPNDMGEGGEDHASRLLPPVSCLGGEGRALIDCLIERFQGQPDLPGVVVVGFDAPCCRTQPQQFGAVPPPPSAQDKWLGRPSQGVVAMVFANTELKGLVASVEENLSGEGEIADCYTPFWERGVAFSQNQIFLAQLPRESRGFLCNVRALARFHKSSEGRWEEKSGRSNRLGEVMRLAMERAMVNAALLPGMEATAAEENSSEDEQYQCEWLVHNAGGVDVCGPRLAALGLALHGFSQEMNPVDEATNFPAKVGNLGAVLPLAMLAQVANKTEETQGPCCWIRFREDGGFFLGFANPVGAANEG